MTVTVFDPTTPLSTTQSEYSQIEQNTGTGALGTTLINADSYSCPGATNINIVYTPGGVNYTIAQVNLGTSDTALATISQSSSTTFAITFSGSGYGAFVAVDPSVSSPISLTDFSNLTSCSNTVVISSSIPTATSSGLQTASSNQSSLLSSLVSNQSVLPSGVGGSGTVPAIPNISHSALQQQATQQIVAAKSEAAYSALWVSSLTKDIHISGEYQALLTWLQSFSPSQTETLGYMTDYSNDVQFSLESWATWQKTRTWAYGSGNHYSKSTSDRHEEAQSYRLNSGTVIDLYAPSVYTRCEDTTIQARNYLLSSDLNRNNSIYSWNRSDKLAVTQSKVGVQYCTSALFAYGSAAYRVSGSLLEQTGQAKLQVTNEYDLVLGQLNATTTSNWVVRSGNLVWQQSTDSTYTVSNKDIFVCSQGENHMSSQGETNIVSGTDLYTSSQGSTHVSAAGQLSLDGSLIQIGMGGFGRPVINLDTNTILGGSNSLSSLGISGASSAGSITSAGVNISPSSAASVGSSAIGMAAGTSAINQYLPSAGSSSSALGSVASASVASATSPTTSQNLTSQGLGNVSFGSSTQLAQQVTSAITSGNTSALTQKLFATGQTALAKSITSLFTPTTSKTVPAAPTTTTVPTPQSLDDYTLLGLPDFDTTSSNGYWSE